MMTFLSMRLIVPYQFSKRHGFNHSRPSTTNAEGVEIRHIFHAGRGKAVAHNKVTGLCNKTSLSTAMTAGLDLVFHRLDVAVQSLRCASLVL
jgi:hypothetical protein